MFIYIHEQRERERENLAYGCKPGISVAVCIHVIRDERVWHQARDKTLPPSLPKFPAPAISDTPAVSEWNAPDPRVPYLSEETQALLIEKNIYYIFVLGV